MKNGGGHIVPLAAVRGEFLDGGEDMTEKIEWSFAGMVEANVLKALETEFFIANTAGFGQAIGAKEQ